MTSEDMTCLRHDDVQICQAYETPPQALLESRQSLEEDPSGCWKSMTESGEVEQKELQRFAELSECMRQCLGNRQKVGNG